MLLSSNVISKEGVDLDCYITAAALALALLVLPGAASASCMTTQMIVDLNAVENHLNITNMTLVNSLDYFCTYTYSRDETDSRLQGVEDDMDMLVSTIDFSSIEERVDVRFANLSDGLKDEYQLSTLQLLIDINNNTQLDREMDLSGYATVEELEELRESFRKLDQDMSRMEPTGMAAAQHTGTEWIPWVIVPLVLGVLYFRFTKPGRRKWRELSGEDGKDVTLPAQAPAQRKLAGDTIEERIKAAEKAKVMKELDKAESGGDIARMQSLKGELEKIEEKYG